MKLFLKRYLIIKFLLSTTFSETKGKKNIDSEIKESSSDYIISAIIANIDAF